MVLINQDAFAIEEEAVSSLENACVNSAVEAKPQAAPARVGLRCSLAKSLEHVEWFGRSPHESYVDHFISARVGRFAGPILDQTFKYVRPQENGNKHETRWMALRTAKAASGLLVRAEGAPCGMRCHRYTLADFDGSRIIQQQKVRHGGELEPRPETVLCVDAAQMGVGGIDSWGAKPLTQHLRSKTEPLSWAFRFVSLAADAKL